MVQDHDKGIDAFEFNDALAHIPERIRVVITAVWVDGEKKEMAAGKIGRHRTGVKKVLDKASRLLPPVLGW